MSKTFFTDGSWSLEEYNFPSIINLALLHSYIAHDCPLYVQGSVWPRYTFHSILMDRPCPVCNEYPPEELMGLWKLHNFDYIQACR